MKYLSFLFFLGLAGCSLEKVNDLFTDGEKLKPQGVQSHFYQGTCQFDSRGSAYLSRCHYTLSAVQYAENIISVRLIILGVDEFWFSFSSGQTIVPINSIGDLSLNPGHNVIAVEPQFMDDRLALTVTENRSPLAPQSYLLTVTLGDNRSIKGFSIRSYEKSYSVSSSHLFEVRERPPDLIQASFVGQPIFMKAEFGNTQSPFGNLRNYREMKISNFVVPDVSGMVPLVDADRNLCQTLNIYEPTYSGLSTATSTRVIKAGQRVAHFGSSLFEPFIFETLPQDIIFNNELICWGSSF